MALGAIGPVTEQDVAAALAILGRNRVPVLVTHLEPGFKRGPDTALRRREPRRHPERVVVLDWVGASAGHRGWFQPYGLHLTFPGAAAYARLLARAIPLTKVPATPGWAESALRRVSHQPVGLQAIGSSAESASTSTSIQTSGSADRTPISSSRSRVMPKSSRRVAARQWKPSRSG